MKTKTLKKITLIMVLSLCSVFLACKSNKKRPLNKVSIALGAPPFSLSPIKATDATGMRIVSLLYQGLVKIGSDLKPQPDLATSWVINKNKYIFQIPKNTLFSDGSTLKCSDLSKSIQSFQEKTCPFNSAFKKIINIECKEEQNLILSFSLKEPSAKFILADLPVLKIFKTSQKKLIMGTGPFQLQTNSPVSSTLSPNKYFKKPQPYSLKIEYLKDDFARFLKVYKGEVDIAPNSIPFEKVNSFVGTNFKVIETPSLSTSYLLLNFKHKQLQNLNFRKKVYTTLNIKDLVLNRFENHVTLAKSLLPPDHPYFSPELLNLDHQSLKKLPLPTKLLTIKTSNSRQSIETGKILAQRLRAQGIPTKLQSYEWGTFYRDVKNGNYDIALMKWVGVVDPDQYNIAFHSHEFPPGRNRGFYDNKKLDLLLEQGRKAFNFSERSNLYNQVQNIVFTDLAIIPLWHENQIHITHPRVRNYSVNPMGDFSSFLNLSIKDTTNEH